MELRAPTGVSTGVVFGHVLEKGPKKELPASVYLEVQRNLYRRYGAAGAVIEPMSLVASAARFRDRWETLHTVRAGIAAAALGALILGSMGPGR